MGWEPGCCFQLMLCVLCLKKFNQAKFRTRQNPFLPSEAALSTCNVGGVYGFYLYLSKAPIAP